MVVSSVGCSMLAIVISLHLAEKQSRERDQAFCAIVITLDDSYNSSTTGPSTPLGKNIAAAIANLRRSLNCSKGTS